MGYIETRYTQIITLHALIDNMLKLHAEYKVYFYTLLISTGEIKFSSLFILFKA